MAVLTQESGGSKRHNEVQSLIKSINSNIDALMKRSSSQSRNELISARRNVNGSEIYEFPELLDTAKDLATRAVSTILAHYSGTDAYARAINQSVSRSGNACIEDIDKLIQVVSAKHSDEIKMGTELEHYGRLGMKWGMHIYGEDEVKKKVDRKIIKNTNRAARMTERSKTYSLRGDNKTAKSNWAWTGIGATVKSRQAKRSYRIAYNSQKKAVRATRRAKKLASNFLQLKGNTRISMFSDTFEKNKHAQEIERYINDVLNNNFDYTDKED